MAQASATQSFPRGALIGAAIIVSVSIAAAATARWTGVGAFRGETVLTVEAVDLTFSDRADGGIAVQGPGGTTVLDPGTNGFVRGVVRGLARDRKLNGIGAEVPFRLIRRVDGRLLLEDPALGRAIDLGAYGSANADAFTRLLRPE